MKKNPENHGVIRTAMAEAPRLVTVEEFAASEAASLVDCHGHIPSFAADNHHHVFPAKS